MRTSSSPTEPPSKSVVYLWIVRLIAAKCQSDHFWATLSGDEKLRTNAFRFKRHRNAFLVARGLLRAILGWYLEVPPENVAFQYGPQGKPALCTKVRRDLHFNLAHSEDWVIYAFSRNCEVGVDLELVRELPEMESIVDNFLASEERAEFFGMSPEARPEAFFNFWTRKEAFLKAIGKGLSVSLDRVQVSLAPDQPAVILSRPGDTSDMSHWTLFRLAPINGYVGALALPSLNCLLQERLFKSAEECLRFLKMNHPGKNDSHLQKN